MLDLTRTVRSLIKLKAAVTFRIPKGTPVNKIVADILNKKLRTADKV